VIIKKQQDMVVQHGSGNYTGILLNGIAWYLSTEEQTGLTEQAALPGSVLDTPDRKAHQWFTGIGQKKTRHASPAKNNL